MICKAQERPQRRHRPVYFAPSVSQWHLQQRTEPQHSNSPTDGGLADLGIPLLLEVPYSSALVVSPPSSAESSTYEFQQQFQQQLHPRTFRQQVMDVFSGMYNGFVDFFLLVIVCFMGLFFYDVEVKVVNRQRARTRGRSGRVVIQTERPPATSLLRTPPRSGNFSRSSRSSRDHLMWEHVV